MNGGAGQQGRIDAALEQEYQDALVEVSQAREALAVAESKVRNFRATMLAARAAQMRSVAEQEIEQ